jgi:hypothetical protein
MSNLKLEVYQILLKKRVGESNTFRDFVDSINNENYNDVDSTIVYLDFFKYFVSKLNVPGYMKNEKSKKAFAALDVSPDPEQASNPAVFLERHFLFGKFEGGKYGVFRRSSPTENKEEGEDVPENNVISEEVYYGLWTPIHSNTGFFFITANPSNTVSQEVLNFLKNNIFNSPQFLKPKIDRYYSSASINALYNNAILDYVKFTTRESSAELDDPSLTNEQHEFKITVSIEPIDGISVNQSESLISSWLKLKFGSRRLQDFERKMGRLSQEGSKNGSSFKLDQEDRLRPIIHLSEHNIDFQENGTVTDSNQIRNLILTILDEEIKPDIGFEDV